MRQEEEEPQRLKLRILDGRDWALSENFKNQVVIEFLCECGFSQEAGWELKL